jgi:hypothetical protein
MSAPIFYHYYPSGEFVRDGPDDVESEHQLKENEGGATIKTIHQIDHLSDIFESSDEEENELLTTISAIEDLDLDGVSLPEMIWTPIKYKPSQVAQFISLMQNKNYKLAKTAKETGIAYDAAYKFNKKWKENEGTVLPGYKLASEVKTKRDNVKITDEQSEFIEDYFEAHPTCIVKDIMEQLSAKFGDPSVNDSTVYRYITKKLEFTLTRTQRRIAARNSEDTKEQRRQFVEYLGDNNVDFKRK